MPSDLLRRPPRSGLVGRILDDPELLPQLRALSPPALRQVVLQVGLEDSAELIALASLEQLRGILDEDLWRSARPGSDEDFDAARFALWLEVLLEAGEAFVADRLAELSEDFLAFAFSQVVRVLEVQEVAESLREAGEAGLLDDVLDTRLCQELDEYLVVSRFEQGWDALWTSVLALDERHGELLRSVLHRCWLATRSGAEDAGGFSTLLREQETLLEDARAERDDRRAAKGYVSPADARAFLALARRPADTAAPDPITRAYFRELERAPTAGASDAGSSSSRATALRQLLAAATVEASAGGVESAMPVALEPEPPRSTCFREGLAELALTDPEVHRRIVEELAYLANVLVAGDVSRAWRGADAAAEVLHLCEAGLRAKLGPRAATEPEAVRAALLRFGAVGLFRVAWSRRPQPGSGPLNPPR